MVDSTSFEADLKSIGRGRLWLFRLLAVGWIPLALLLGELVLGWVGVGYDSSFVVDGPRQGISVSHHRFGWRFFPRSLARQPVPFEVSAKEPGTRRIFVLGGSAAQGVPEPGFSVGRQLQAMLELTYPEQRFEVVNAAMTAINSHVVLPIAEDCAQFDPDLFVIYMGNNEVVGPYGAGSVFGSYSPKLSWLRWAIRLKTSRWAQWIDGWRQPAPGASTWRGMEMFLEQQVPLGDPRLRGVYEHYGRNLRDIAAAGRRAGAEVVVSTVASNMVRQAPFASLAPDLPQEQTTEWQRLVDRGVEKLQAGDPLDALESLERAAAMDDRNGLLSFLRGKVLLSLERDGEAMGAFQEARDLDTLRFRADSGLNEVLRGVASSEGLGWVDAEDELLRQSLSEDNETPLFYEHVHFTFAGNHALAKALLPAVARRLELEPEPSGPLPSVDEVARYLAFTPYDALVMERAMASLVERPPFVDLWGRNEDLQHRREAIWKLRRSLDETTWETSRQLYLERLESHPDDLLTRRRWAEHLGKRGDHGEAIEHWRDLTDRYPGGGAWHDALAASLSAAGELDDAMATLEVARHIAPERHSEILINEGRIQAEHGRLEQAEALYREAATARPKDPIPWYNLAHLAVQRQDLKAATEAFEALTRRFPDFALGHYNLGVARARGDALEASLASFDRASVLDPFHAPTVNSRGLSLERLGRVEEAEGAYRQALELDPGYLLATFNLADLWLARDGVGDLERAADLYRKGLAEQPGNRAAQQNLALAERRLAERTNP